MRRGIGIGIVAAAGPGGGGLGCRGRNFKRSKFIKPSVIAFSAARRAGAERIVLLHRRGRRNRLGAGGCRFPAGAAAPGRELAFGKVPNAVNDECSGGGLRMEPPHEAT